jgi:hypothetical protein
LRPLSCSLLDAAADEQELALDATRGQDNRLLTVKLADRNYPESLAPFPSVRLDDFDEGPRNLRSLRAGLHELHPLWRQRHVLSVVRQPGDEYARPTACRDAEVSVEGTAIVAQRVTPSELRDAVAACEAERPIDTIALAATVQNRHEEKWDWALDEATLCALYASRTLVRFLR